MVALLCIGAAGMALAEPAESKETEKSGWLGVYSDNLSKPMLVALDIDHGVLVTDVVENSPAAAGDLESGDVIVSIDGQKVAGTGDLRSVVRARPGQTVSVALRRRGREKKLTVKLEAKARSKTEYDLDLDLPGLPLEALKSARVAIKEAGPGIKMKVLQTDETLDSLRAELEQLREELRDLRRSIVEEGKK
jgi:membrane-associated protease RseP (regulator of RpoE activity)